MEVGGIRILAMLLLASVAQSVHADDLPVRIQYDQDTAPNGVIFRSLVRPLVHEWDDLDDDVDPRIDLLWPLLNTDGSWTYYKEPKFSREEAAELIDYFRAINHQVISAR